MKMKYIIIPIIIAVIFVPLMLSNSGFYEHAKLKTDQFSTIVEEFYQNKAQQTLNDNINNFKKNLMPDVLKAIVFENLETGSFQRDLFESLGQQYMYVNFYEQYHVDFNIRKTYVNNIIQEWELKNSTRELSFHKNLFAKNGKPIGTVHLIFLENNIGSLELFLIKHFPVFVYGQFSLGTFFQEKKNIDFFILFSIPVFTLLILYLGYREIKKRGRVGKFSMEMNISILAIIFAIVSVVYITKNSFDGDISRPLLLNQDQMWYAEKLLDQAKRLERERNYILAQDYLKDIEEQHLSQKRQTEMIALKSRLRRI